METLIGACEKRQEFATRGLDRLMAAFEGHKRAALGNVDDWLHEECRGVD